MTPGISSIGSYQDVSLDDLMLYIVWSLSEKNKKFEWHNVVIHSHELFPLRFGLPHHENEYPDSAQVDRSLLRCRNKGLLRGRRREGYSLTASGLEVAYSVSKRIKNVNDQKKIETVKTHKKSRAGIKVKRIKQSTAYKKYTEGEKEEINDYDVCTMLFCTLDVGPEIKRKNLERFREDAQSGNWNDVVECLDWIEKRFSHLFNVSQKPRKGMFG